MKCIYYNPQEEKGGCVLRAFSKALNKDYSDVLQELMKININYNDEKVFDKYLKSNGFIIDETNKNKLFKNYIYNGVNIVFSHDNDWYHMFTIVDNVIYDKYSFEDLENMKIIKIYKK